MQHVGDDAVGRALDRLFDADRAALLTDVVVAALNPTRTMFEKPASSGGCTGASTKKRQLRGLSVLCSSTKKGY